MTRPHADAHQLEQQNRIISEVTDSLDKVEKHFDAALHAPPPRDENQGGGSSSEKADPVRIDIVQARHGAMRDLVSWVNFVLMEVNDGTISHGPTTVDVPGLVAFIRRWVPAIVEQCPDDASNLRKEMAKHGRTLEGLAMGWTVRRIPIGRCPEQNVEVSPEGVEEFTPCTGSLWAELRDEDDTLPEAVVCDLSGRHRWSPWEWRHLGRMLNGGVDPLDEEQAAVGA